MSVHHELTATFAPCSGTPDFHGSTPRASWDLALFMTSLSEEQRELFRKLDLQSGAPNATPEPAQPTPATPATSVVYAGTSWYDLAPGRASKVEVRVMTTVLVERLDVDALHTWLKEASTDATRMAQLGDQWAPLQDSTASL